VNVKDVSPERRTVTAIKKKGFHKEDVSPQQGHRGPEREEVQLNAQNYIVELYNLNEW